MATQNEPTLIDEERLRNVLARAATHSRDAGLVERYLVNGAGFWVRTVEDKQTVEVIPRSQCLPRARRAPRQGMGHHTLGAH
jgi:hypothetical protein